MRGKPITVAAVETDPEFVWVEADGSVRDHYDLTFTPEDFERIRLGYACLRCWELQESAYPKVEKHLPGCVYAPDGMKERQLADLANEFHGEKWVGPKKRLEETLAEDDERRAKYEADTGLKAGITVPPWVRL